MLLRQCLDIIGNTIRQSKNIRCQWLEARLVNCYSISMKLKVASLWLILALILSLVMVALPLVSPAEAV